MGDKTKAPMKELRYQRECRGWSQQRLADQIDTSSEMVSKWERGVQMPGKYYQEKLCQLFGKSAEELGFMNAAKTLEPSLETDLLLGAFSKQNSRPQDILTPLTQSVPQNVVETGQEIESLHLNELRRSLLQQMPGVLGAVTVPSLTLFNFESWERLSKALNKSSYIDERSLDQFETIIGNYWQLFYSTTSSDLLHGVLGFLQTLTSLLERSYPTNLEQRLCAIAGMNSSSPYNIIFYEE